MSIAAELCGAISTITTHTIDQQTPIPPIILPSALSKASNSSTQRTPKLEMEIALNRSNLRPYGSHVHDSTNNVHVPHAPLNESNNEHDLNTSDGVTTAYKNRSSELTLIGTHRLSHSIPKTSSALSRQNGYILFNDIIRFIMDLWQHIALFCAIILPIFSIGSNEIVLPNSGIGGHSCMLLYQKAICWGLGTSGQLGQGNENDYWELPSDPIRLNSDFVPNQIVIGLYHSCTLSIDGRVACWGNNLYGQLGQEHSLNIGEVSSQMGDALQDTDLGSNFIASQLVTGRQHTCAISTDSELKCWGYNWYGELGKGHTNHLGDHNGEMGDNLGAIQLGDDFIPNKVAVGWSFTCALSIKNAIKCWGWNVYYQLGDGTTQNRGDDVNEMGNNLTAVDLGTHFVPIDIEAGAWHVCTVTESRTVKCWGRNNYGQLGIACGWTQEFGDVLPTLDFSAQFVPEIIRLGYGHSCFVSTNRSTMCFGWNQDGQLGYGDTSSRGGCGDENLSNIAMVDFGTDFRVEQIMVMSNHGCVLSVDDELKCWGSNYKGNLGYNDEEDRGDEAEEMGDNLAIVSFPFTADPTAQTKVPTEQPSISPSEPSMEPTTEPIADITTAPSILPTTDPTADPTTGPTVDPTTDPATTSSTDTTPQPTIEPFTTQTGSLSTNPTAYSNIESTTSSFLDPTNQPTYTPSTEPTMRPSTLCDSLRNCTVCLSMNPDNRTHCLWHSAHDQCSFVYDVVLIDEHVIVDFTHCDADEFIAASTNIAFYQWIALSLILCIILLIVVYVLKRYKKKHSKDQSELSQVIEMKIPPNVERRETMKSRDDQEAKEPDESYSEGSRCEGVENDEGNNTIFVTNTKEHADV